MAENSAYALWLCSWYPNKLESLTGDFIQRHAQAVSIYMPVHVVAIIHDPNGKVTSSTLVESSNNGNLTETILYYHTKNSNVSILQKYRRYAGYFNNGNAVINDIFKRRGIPTLIHAHVAIFAGILANRVSKKTGIPYFISEHWTAYLEEAIPNFSDFNLLTKKQWHTAMKAADNISAVSFYLSNRLQHLCGRKVTRIPNVVDTLLFTPNEKRQHPQLLHISTFNDQKQVDKILHAFSKTVSKITKAKLVMVGPKSPELEALGRSLGLDDSVIWKAEMPQHRLVSLMQESSALVLFSAYETFGCVVIEANATGIPVIVSDIPVLREIVKEGENGWLVSPEKVMALADAMEYALRAENQHKMIESCRHSSLSFSFNKVGKEFIEFYGHKNSSFYDAK
jgi:glycosyltransferase involved in cell wall biosynthesis